jgi:hypothetical protein
METIPSGPWDDDSFGDQAYDGHSYSDVEETVSLINKPRQVCFFLLCMFFYF